MTTSLAEWLHLVVRWMHVLAGIMWIGTSIFFNWLDSHLERPMETRAGVEGELWMVHSGGFYQVEKTLVAPARMPKTLHWFVWEATFTWFTGFWLLFLVYYMGGGALLTDPNVSDLSPTAATVLCVSLLVGSWFVYDVLWVSPLGQSNLAAGTITVGIIGGVAYGLSHVLSGRAAFMHVGAMMGSWMAWNVWVRIIPAQRALVRSTKEGTKPDPVLGKKAKQRSRHNNYMTYPVVFVMLSNHFPGAYGSPWNWAILLGLFAVGVAIRHLENTGDRSPVWVFAALGVVALGADFVANRTPATSESGAAASEVPVIAAPNTGGAPADAKGLEPAKTGSLKGSVRWMGAAPARKIVNIPSTCSPEAKGPTYAHDVLVRDGRLQNAFVWIKTGLAPYAGGPPAEEVVVDQKGCLYAPRVVGVMAGQQVTFLNSDPVLHNVRTVSKVNPSFNVNMPSQGMRIGKRFDQPEVTVQARCDVHPWMVGFIGVSPHPYFAVSDVKGEFALERVPAGEYEIEAKHEVFGARTARVTVEAQKTAQVELVFGN